MYFARTDNQNRVIGIVHEINAEPKDTPLDGGWRDRITSQYTEYPAPLTDASGVHLYMIENGLIRNCTEAEMAEERSMLPPRDNDLLLEMAADHEYRICLMELGVTKDDL